MKCQNCQTENKYTDMYCHTCGEKLLNYKFLEEKKNLKKHILLLFLIPFIFPIIMFMFSVGIFTFEMYSETSNTLENVQETKGKLVSYVNCDYEYQLYKCNGLYSYNVDGKEYQIQDTKWEHIEVLEKEITVYYNIINPSESSTTFEYDNNFNKIFLIISGILFSIIIITIIIICKLLKGSKKNKINVDEIGNKPIKL